MPPRQQEQVMNDVVDFQSTQEMGIVREVARRMVMAA
uniref:Uncharacterized protein n=1 Tax=Peronospora matthiolae TaxID=2874970 RepID=A0AAV1UCN8_9STRA